MKIDRFDFNENLAKLPFKDFEVFYNGLKIKPKETAEEVYILLGGKIEKKVKKEKEVFS